ncbi:molybdenum cofactor biosynthesis protein MoaE [Chitinibacter fontanus]|uniref:Molybdopterin synthase catalytic subunit n=1 Tax=Chitinibacter fontanus TaxID=1737446 RepID=A0A7D5VCG9_9NEIS|nr:molybdenum cofactor biosynthesis protein MoaE [Chitinibacter fontanus]
MTIIHRVGQLAFAELVITASQHPVAAYAANTYLMDLIKTQAPFGRKEITQQGEH